MIVQAQPGVETLLIRTFGGLAVWLGDVAPATAGVAERTALQRIKFETHTVEALLVYLACHGRPLGRDALAELLWPERTQTQARANLRVALHNLRRTLAPYLLVTRQSVALNPTARIDLDAAQFEAQLAAGQLGAATALYRGDFLEGFYRDSSPLFEQWALLERERLRTLAIAAYQQLSVQCAAAGQLDAALASAHRLLQLDPLHEPTHRHLMRLLAQSGQRSAALAQYETCRHLLTTELGATPDETTTTLYEQIRSGEYDKMTRWQDDKMIRSFSHPVSLSSSHPVTPSPFHNLPRQPTPFIGRAAELAQIEQLLANPDCRLLTLLGVGGIGKTRLAVEIATRQGGNFADGICFVSLAPVATADLVPIALAQSLGLQHLTGDLQAAIAAYLRPRTLLLVLDNFEHLLETTDTATDMVASLLQNASQVKLLVTSRTRLSLREEWLCPVAGLSLAAGWLGEAGQLFLRSAQRVQPGFSAQGQEEAIVAICRQVEGMPLALELAASWVRVMPCAAIADQIQTNFDFLTTPLRNLPERHRSLRALFDQSWRLLSPLEQGVLMRLSVFRGGWRLEEAAAVTGATLALLLGLVDKSLVRASGQQRFDLHELVRQYAAERLVASDEGALIRQRHYAAYLHLVRTGDSYLRGPEATTWLARLEPEQDNLRAALQWAIDEARYADMAWLLVAVFWFWFLGGHWYEQGRWIAQLLPYRQALDLDLHLAILINLYAVTRSLEELQPVERWESEVMQLLESGPHPLLQAAALNFIAGTSYTNLPKGAVAFERSIALARAAAESPPLSTDFGMLADRGLRLGTALWLYADRLNEYGKFEQAIPLLRESQAIFQARGSQYELSNCLATWGRMALLQGDVTRAHQFLSEAAALAAEFNYHEMLGWLRAFLGLATVYQGNIAEARRILRENHSFCTDLKAKGLVARNAIYLAETALSEGLVDEADHGLRQSFAYYANPRRIRIDQLERLLVAARLAAAQQQDRRAATLFGLADQISSRLDYVVTGPRREVVDTALATVQAALDPAVFAAAFAAGQQMSLEEAFATVLAPPERST